MRVTAQLTCDHVNASRHARGAYRAALPLTRKIPQVWKICPTLPKNPVPRDFRIDFAPASVFASAPPH
jgi:hypothetical protein